jgi:hypothetical protein
MDLNEMINRFRLAGRELFNNFFHMPDPWKSSDLAFQLEARFSAVEEVLFRQLVLEPAGLPFIGYKNVQPLIQVELAGSDFAPIKLNREIKSGYWDHPIKEVTRDAVLLFMGFFDYDILSYRDNRYVLVQVESWPSHPDAVGKQALLESQYVRFTQLGGTGAAQP